MAFVARVGSHSSTNSTKTQSSSHRRSASALTAIAEPASGKRHPDPPKHRSSPRYSAPPDAKIPSSEKTHSSGSVKVRPPSPQAAVRRALPCPRNVPPIIVLKAPRERITISGRRRSLSLIRPIRLQTLILERQQVPMDDSPPRLKSSSTSLTSIPEALKKAQRTVAEGAPPLPQTVPITLDLNTRTSSGARASVKFLRVLELQSARQPIHIQTSLKHHI